MNFKFSFIIVTRNNNDGLSKTLKSIGSFSPNDSEIIIVDGNDIALDIIDIKNFISFEKFSVNIIRDDMQGIYNAMNVGVLNSTGKFIIQMPAGDLLYKNAAYLLETCVDDKFLVHVFDQLVADYSGEELYKYSASSKGLWPHQSVVLNKMIHDIYGLYDIKCKYTADQVLFSKIRKLSPIKYHPGVLSIFLLGGFSSGASYNRSKEIYLLHRSLGSGLFTSSYRSLTPHIRLLLQRIFNDSKLISKIKIKLFSGNSEI